VSECLTEHQDLSSLIMCHLSC